MKNKICFICKLGIGDDEPFVKVVEHKNKNTVKSTGHYHLECFRERISCSNDLRQMQAVAKQVLGQANKLLVGCSAS